MNFGCANRFAVPLGLTAMLLVTAACGGRSPLETIGVRVPPPDEFQVIARKPLEMPPAVALPDPQPGAPSLVEPDPHRDAVQAVFGTSASPSADSAAPSTGEQLLLNSANAAAASSEIRVQLEQDKTEKKPGKEYEAPTVAELLGLSGSGEKLDEEELLDPVAEAQRLQREGLVVPADPNAEAPEGEAGETPPEWKPREFTVGRGVKDVPQ